MIEYSELRIGDYVRNKKTGVRGDVMAISYAEVKVVRHPSDLQGGLKRRQTWEIKDVERMPSERS